MALTRHEKSLRIYANERMFQRIDLGMELYSHIQDQRKQHPGYMVSPPEPYMSTLYTKVFAYRRQRPSQSCERVSHQQSFFMV